MAQDFIKAKSKRKTISVLTQTNKFCDPFMVDKQKKINKQKMEKKKILLSAKMELFGQSRRLVEVSNWNYISLFVSPSKRKI